MRLPFLQVSQEEMARARTLAGYLSVPFAHALGMTVALKASALESAPAGDVSGGISDPNPAEWMAVQCGWPLDRADALASALVRCGFAMAGPSGGYVVAGMEPYAKALDTSGKRSEAGRRGAQERWGRQKYGPAMAPNAKTQTQTQKKEETSSAVADAPPAAALELVPVEPPKRKPGKSSALSEFIDWFRAETRKQLAPDAPDNCRMETHQAARLGEAVKLHGLETCKAAVGLWMGWEGSRTAGYPLGMFAAKWEGWVGRVRAPGSTSQRAETSAGRGAEGQDCAGCGKGGEGGRVGAVFLGYDCGCARAWHGAGLPYTDAEEWARNRRAGRAA